MATATAVIVTPCAGVECRWCLEVDCQTLTTNIVYRLSWQRCTKFYADLQSVSVAQNEPN